MDITPAISDDKKIVETYGDLQFKISGERYQGSVVVFPEKVQAWGPRSLEEITPESLSSASRERVDVLLLGCGPKMVPLPRGLKDQLRAAGIIAEPMDTGAACRTYNVLMMEGRQVAAALIAVE